MIDAAAVLLAWVQTHPSYSYTVDASERAGSGADERVTLRISYSAREGVERVRVLAGKGAGTDVLYAGGDRAKVRVGGFLHAVPVSVGIRDPRLLSPRKNDVRVGILGEVAACFARHGRAAVALPLAEGRIAIEIREPGGFGCGAADGDDRVTVDRIVIDGDGRPLQRERYVGEALVVRWTIRDVNTDGLARSRRERAPDALADERSFLRGRSVRDERVHRHVRDAAAAPGASPGLPGE